LLLNRIEMILAVFLIYTYSLFIYSFINRKSYKCNIFLLFLFLLVTAISRPETMLDYQDYKIAFELESQRMEPTFLFLSLFIKSFFSGSFIILVIIYALLGISLKIWIIHKCSISFWLSILVYISNFYLLHDLIQIRVSVSAALFLIALYYYNYGEKWKVFCLILLSILFHYSSIILLFIFLVRKNKINKPLYILIIVGSYFLSFMHLGIPLILANINMDIVQKAFIAYENNIYVSTFTLNIFNIIQLLRICIAFLLLSKIGLLKTYPMVILFLKVYIYSIACYALFSEMPVIAVRISELLGVVEIMLLPFLALCFRPKKIGNLMVVTFSLLLLFMNVFHNNLIR